MQPLDTNKLRTARHRRANLADPATMKVVLWDILNDFGTLISRLNIFSQIDEQDVELTTGEEISFTYTNLAVASFLEGEIVTGGTSTATGVVVSDDGTTLVLNTLTGIFENAESISGADSGATADIDSDPITADGAVVVTYDNLVGGPFQFGELVTETTSGATGVVVSDDGTTLILKDVTGRFDDNSAIEGDTSLATADVNGATAYCVLDLTRTAADIRSGTVPTLFNLTSDNANVAIGSIINAPDAPFKIIAGGSAVFEFINGTIKTSAGADLVLKGSTGDWATFETKNSIVKQTGVMIYAS